MNEANPEHNHPHRLTYSATKRLIRHIYTNLSTDEIEKLRHVIKQSLGEKVYIRKNGEDLLPQTVYTALIIIEEMALRGAAISAIFLFRPVIKNMIDISSIEKTFGADVAKIVAGLNKISHMEANQSTLASENYTNLLLSMAEDIRVILIMIANRLHHMRYAKIYDDDRRLKLAVEVSYIYTPLAHKLGLYIIKTELEDLYLKYTDRESYDFIIQKINESKDQRDQYIHQFIEPIEAKLKETGLKYDMKGRVKSISSINNKLKKQKVDFEYIYDLFAIRIILDSPLDKEKAECWQIYSIVTDLYTPNPKRLKDWLSIPKSNGYESLHTTVMAQQSRWVEVQIRTRRMDEIAERGFAAHWKYKGVKSNQSKIDDWLTNLREILENKSVATTEKLEDFKLDMYDEEIYVFTPKGDLHKLPQGATVLDFAFSIHTRIGATCVSGKVNGKNVPIRYKLNSGDQIEINTSPNQTPKQDWLNIVTTTKAKNRIRQKLKEESSKQVELAKELFARRCKNKKIDISEAILMRVIKKLGFKNVTDFYIKIADESLDVNNVIDQYTDMEKREADFHEKYEVTSADKYTAFSPEAESQQAKGEELVIDQHLTGIDYKLARCCNPIYGDDIFGFISTSGIKIHRKNCPNAHDMFTRFGYRVVPARWSGKSSAGYTTTLRIIGNDDIGIVNNITSVIAKESNINMRSISIDSNDGLFQGNITVSLGDTAALNGLVKKLKAIKGIKQVSRIN